MKFIFLTLALATASLANSPVRFDEFQVYRVTPETNHHLDTLHQIQEQNLEFNFWSDVSGVGTPVDIMVPPHLKDKFADLVRLQKLNTQVHIKNVQQLIDEEKPYVRNQSRAFDWNSYQTLDAINTWLSSLAAQYPKIVSTVVGGQSYEGRKIFGIKISYKAGNKGVFLEGGIHAREWISPATLTYIVNQLLTSPNRDVRAVAENHDWYVFPVINPDGYAYTHSHNRMWRKTRKPYGSCYGADPNRNWGYNWMNGGASNTPCSETYAGPSGFSEIETKSLANYISSIANNLDVYLAFHSYSQLLMIPFGHAGLEKPANNAELLSVGKIAANKLAQRYGTQYKVGNIPDIIYVASGGSVDWVLGTHRNIPFTYIYELRDKGRHGFVLPPQQIIPTGEETLDSVVSIVQQASARP